MRVEEGQSLKNDAPFSPHLPFTSSLSFFFPSSLFFQSYLPFLSIVSKVEELSWWLRFQSRKQVLGGHKDYFKTLLEKVHAPQCS